MKKEFKNIKGITLIALVVTIVILLILTSVTMAILINTNLIGNSKEAVDQYRVAQINEEIVLNALDDKIFEHVDSSRNTVDKFILIAESDSLTDKTFNIAEKYDDYANLTIDNIFLEFAGMSYTSGAQPDKLTSEKSYDKNTGILSVTRSSIRAGGYDFYSKYNVYIKVTIEK